jgi:hypothetical protein
LKPDSNVTESAVEPQKDKGEMVSTANGMHLDKSDEHLENAEA